MKGAAGGHTAALITILIWGTTFISTKVLLADFSPIEILFVRFAIGYVALWCVYPRPMKRKSWSQEGYFAAAGLCGVTLYYLFENIALTYTMASNVGVIISVAPFFTAIFACLLLGEKRPNARFFVGFVIAMAGIVLLSVQGVANVAISPLGDCLAVVAAVIWAGYSTLTKKISGFGYPTIQTTRRVFFYGLLFMLPALWGMDLRVTGVKMLHWQAAGNLLFLGLGASALCFVTWNFSVKVLGAVKTTVYIYMVPVITTVTSMLVLGEEITPGAVCGIILTLAGLFLSEDRSRKACSVAAE